MVPPREVWFWPQRDGVKGFLGTAAIIVAGLNPSMGPGRWRRRRPEASDNFFYGCLRAERLENAHITDIVKVKATKQDVPLLLFDPSISQLHRQYFKRELRIVQPAVVVVMGQLTLDVLRGWRLVVPDEKGQWILKARGGGKIAVVPTVHPAATRWPTRTAERRTRFRKDVRTARRLAARYLGS